MDSSGRIFTPEQVAAMDAEEQRRRQLEQIPLDEMARVTKMNRDRRIRWHQQRRDARLAALQPKSGV